MLLSYLISPRRLFRCFLLLVILLLDFSLVLSVRKSIAFPASPRDTDDLPPPLLRNLRGTYRVAEPLTSPTQLLTYDTPDTGDVYTHIFWSICFASRIAASPTTTITASTDPATFVLRVELLRCFGSDSDSESQNQSPGPPCISLIEGQNHTGCSAEVWEEEPVTSSGVVTESESESESEARNFDSSFFRVVVWVDRSASATAIDPSAEIEIDLVGEVCLSGSSHFAVVMKEKAFVEGGDVLLFSLLPWTQYFWIRLDNRVESSLSILRNEGFDRRISPADPDQFVEEADFYDRFKKDLYSVVVQNDIPVRGALRSAWMNVTIRMVVGEYVLPTDVTGFFVTDVYLPPSIQRIASVDFPIPEGSESVYWGWHEYVNVEVLENAKETVPPKKWETAQNTEFTRGSNVALRKSRSHVVRLINPSKLDTLRIKGILVWRPNHRGFQGWYLLDDTHFLSSEEPSYSLTLLESVIELRWNLNCSNSVDLTIYGIGGVILWQENSTRCEAGRQLQIQNAVEFVLSVPGGKEVSTMFSLSLWLSVLPPRQKLSFAIQVAMGAMLLVIVLALVATLGIVFCCVWFRRRSGTEEQRNERENGNVEFGSTAARRSSSSDEIMPLLDPED